MTQKDKQVVAKNYLEESINMRAEVDISDLVTDAPVTKKTREEIEEWTEKKREETRENLTMMLVGVFSLTLIASFILTGVAAFNKDVNKDFIQSQVSLLITVTSNLLTMGVGYYLGTSQKKK